MEGTIPIPADIAKSDRSVFEYKYVVYTKKSKKGEISVYEQLTDYGVQGIVNRWLEIPKGATPKGKYITIHFLTPSIDSKE